jgi:tRNA-2-methylthio-N6-dimethylallyladenosine synthase
MPSLHMPLQSGSSKVLKDMRRSYRQSKFLGIIERVRAAIPEAAITTDIIVGFPGETEEDFAETLKVVREARFSSAFTFQYSKRPGTPAADLPDQIAPEVVADRYQRLTELQNQISWEENQRLEGRVLEVLVAEGEGRRDDVTGRLSGRAPDNRLVHFNATLSPEIEPVDIRPGDMVTVEVTRGAPHYLEADGAVLAVRRTRSGDAWQARHSTPAAPAGVSLGMPGLGVPASLPDAPVCG